jgi:hypothetical protein
MDVSGQPVGPTLKGQALQEECRKDSITQLCGESRGERLFLTDGTDRLSRNVGNQLPIHTA